MPSKAARPARFLGLANLFSGGALLQLSIFALGIMPYITASIIVQLLTVVIPRFEALKKEGQSGQAKLTQYTRYLTIGLAILQSATLVTFARNPSASSAATATDHARPVDGHLLIMVLTMTAGTGLIMWHHDEDVTIESSGMIVGSCRRRGSTGCARTSRGWPTAGSRDRSSGSGCTA